MAVLHSKYAAMRSRNTTLGAKRVTAQLSQCSNGPADMSASENSGAVSDAEGPRCAAYTGRERQRHVPGEGAAESQQQAARRQDSSRGAAGAHDGFGGVPEGRARPRGRPHVQGWSDQHAARRQGQMMGRGLWRHGRWRSRERAPHTVCGQ